jgi:hypothetical protein
MMLVCSPTSSQPEREDRDMLWPFVVMPPERSVHVTMK